MSITPPWKTPEEARAAFEATERETEAARAAGSIPVDTDEGFEDFIQFVGESEWRYQDVYYAWPQLTPEQWAAQGIPPLHEDHAGMYGSLVRIHAGTWSGFKGIYLRKHPDAPTHQVALTGPTSGGNFRVVELPTSHFRIKSLDPNIRGGVLVPYEHALERLRQRRMFFST